MGFSDGDEYMLTKKEWVAIILFGLMGLIISLFLVDTVEQILKYLFIYCSMAVIAIIITKIKRTQQ